MRLRRLPVLVAMALVPAIAAACSDDGGSPPDEEELGLGRMWVVTSITQGGDQRPIVGGTTIMLIFEDGVVHASAGCEGIRADTTFEGDELLIDQLVIDQLPAEGALCDAEALEEREDWLVTALEDQEDWVVSLLQARPSVSVDEDGLTLATDDTTVELVVGGVADT